MKTKLIVRLATGLILSCAVSQASAVMVTVDWSATVTPNSTEATPGIGVLTGSLGTFDVLGVGEVFDIPSDGSLSVIASGFTSGFPNDTYQLTRETSRPFQLEFTSFGASASDFSVNIVNNNAGILSPFPNSCTVNGFLANCFVALFDDSNTGEDIAIASLGLNGSINDSSHGLINYSYTVATVPVPASVLLFSSGIVGLVATRFRRIRK